MNQFAWADAKSEMKSEWQKKSHLCWELQCHSWAPSQNLKLTFFLLCHKVLNCWLSVTSCFSWHVLAQLLTCWNLVLDLGMSTASAVNFHCCLSETFTSLKPYQLKQEDLQAEPSHDVSQCRLMSSNLHWWALHTSVTELSYDDLLLQALQTSQKNRFSWGHVLNLTSWPFSAVSFASFIKLLSERSVDAWI